MATTLCFGCATSPEELRFRKKIASVDTMISQNVSHFNPCFADYLVRVPSAKNGELIYSWVIQQSGAVSDLNLVSKTTGDDALALCLQNKLKKMQFAADRNEGPLFVKSYPIKFARK